MKRLLPLLLLFIASAATAQVTVVVTPADTTVCFRDSIAFAPVITGAGTAKITYRWQLNLQDIPGATDSLYVIDPVTENSPGIYRCIVAVTGLGSDTSNDATLQMRPRMYIDTLYRSNPLSCPGECKGQFKALASGGTRFKNSPWYIYEWHGGHSQDTIVFGLCRGNRILTVTDSLGCHYDTAYYTDVLKLPKVRFSVTPEDSIIYTTNPTLKVNFPDSARSHITNWTWNFGDSVKVANVNPASHTYGDTIKAGMIPVSLTFTDLNGCDTTVIVDVQMKVPELKIPNLFTPNDDQTNDRFGIELNDDKKKDFRVAYLANELLVYDRWGRKVFSKENYKSEDWDGGGLSDGTYYYILKLTAQYSDEVKKGSVTILTGHH